MSSNTPLYPMSIPPLRVAIEEIGVRRQRAVAQRACFCGRVGVRRREDVALIFDFRGDRGQGDRGQSTNLDSWK